MAGYAVKQFDLVKNSTHRDKVLLGWVVDFITMRFWQILDHLTEIIASANVSLKASVVTSKSFAQLGKVKVIPWRTSICSENGQLRKAY